MAFKSDLGAQLGYMILRGWYPYDEADLENNSNPPYKKLCHLVSAIHCLSNLGTAEPYSNITGQYSSHKQDIEKHTPGKCSRHT